MTLELHDDRETLEAALALIDEWELEITLHHDKPPLTEPAPPSPSTDSDTTCDSAVSDQSAVQPSSTRTRAGSGSRRSRADKAPCAEPAQLGRREELVFLRQKLRDLEAELAAVNAVHDGTQSSLLDQRAQQLDARWVWQQIAARQLDDRQKSERENLQLRVQVEEQIQIAKDLMHVLLRAYRRGDDSKRSSEQEDEMSHVKRVKLPTTGHIEMSVEAQIQRINELYGERSATFSATPFTNGTPVHRDIRVMEHENGEATINVDSSWVLPFDVDHVASAFWLFLVRKSERRIDELGQLDGFNDDRDLLVTQYESNTTAQRLVGSFRGQFVARRVRARSDHEPAYVLWNLWSNPINFKPVSMDGVCLQNESIMRIVWADQTGQADQTAASTTSSSSNKGSEGRLCVVQISQRVHVRLAAAETPTRRRRVGALTDYMMYTIESELQWKQSVLESLLLRSAVPSAPDSAHAWSYSSMALPRDEKPVSFV